MRGDTTSSLSKEPDPQHRTGTLKHKLLLWCLNVDYYNGVSWQKEPFNPCWGSGRMQFLVSKEGWMREAGEAERMFKVVKITASSALWNWGKDWEGFSASSHSHAMGRDIFLYPRLLQAPKCPSLTSRDEEPRAPLDETLPKPTSVLVWISLLALGNEIKFIIPCVFPNFQHVFII